MVCVASAPQGIAFAGMALPCLETWRGRVLKGLEYVGRHARPSIRQATAFPHPGHLKRSLPFVVHRLLVGRAVAAKQEPALAFLAVGEMLLEIRHVGGVQHFLRRIVGREFRDEDVVHVGEEALSRRNILGIGQPQICAARGRHAETNGMGLTWSSSATPRR